MAWKHDVDRCMEKALGNLSIPINYVQAQEIIKEACEEFNLPEISLIVSDRQPKLKYGHAQRLAGGGYHILLYPNALNTLSVLHEIAHCFPDGYNHYIGWTYAFFTLVQWFNVIGGDILASACSGIDISDMPD